VVHLVNSSSLEVGSIEHTIAHLLLWGKRTSKGLAKVEFYSAFSREQVIEELGYGLTEKNIPLQQITLPVWENPATVLNFLLSELERIDTGVVSITGFETAFNEADLLSGLRLLNFNRENLARFNLRQIWWMSHSFNNQVLYYMPDLNSWFFLRLSLTEVAAKLSFTTDILNTYHPDIPAPLYQSNLPYLGNSHFVGREDILHKLQQTSASGLTVIKGVGGIGKTELAVQYAQRYRYDYPGGICWLNALNSDISFQIINFARSHLGLIIPEGLTRDNQVYYCWQKWPKEKTLIIIDDLRDSGQIETYLPPFDKQFSVIVTTRFAYLSNTTFKQIDLDILSTTESLEILSKYLGKERLEKEGEAAYQLCAKLGYLPLAIELAGSYLAQAPNYTIDEYIETLLTETETIVQVLELSWKSLSPKAQHLAYILSLFAPTNFSWEWLEEIPSFPLLSEIRDRELLPLHFLSSSQDSMGKNYFYFHPLLQKFFSLKLSYLSSSEQDEIKQFFCTMMVKLTQQIPQVITLKEVAQYTFTIPHLKKTSVSLEQYLSAESLLVIFNTLGQFYIEQGLYTQAEIYLTTGANLIKQRVGEDSLNYAEICNNLGELYRQKGKYFAAEELLIKSLNISENQLEKNYINLITINNNLGLLYMDINQKEKSQYFLFKALDIYNNNLDQNDAKLSRMFNNLGLLHLSYGQYEKAEELFQQALYLNKTQSAIDYSNIVCELHNLATLRFMQKRYDEAEYLLIRCLDIFKQQLGENHLGYAETLANLAIFYSQRNRYYEAENLYFKSIAMLRNKLGNAHPKTQEIIKKFLSYLSNRADFYKSINCYELCNRYLQQANNLLESVIDN
jgi:tetratricopeptide (TPR) repeat protein